MKKMRIVIEIDDPEVIERLEGMSKEEIIECLSDGELNVDLCNECSVKVEFEQARKTLISDKPIMKIGRG